MVALETPAESSYFPSTGNLHRSPTNNLEDKGRLAKVIEKQLIVLICRLLGMTASSMWQAAPTL